MKHALEEKVDLIATRMKARTRADGSARPGYEQNVARMRAELELISARIEYVQNVGDQPNAE